MYNKRTFVTSGFRRLVNGIFALLGR